MQLPQWLARFNRYVTNPIQRLWAGWIPAYGIIEHVGLRSGKQYRTPVNVFPTEDGLAILLTYGPGRDWQKNLDSAGGGKIRHDAFVYRAADDDESGSGAERDWPVLLKRVD